MSSRGMAFRTLPFGFDSAPAVRSPQTSVARPWVRRAVLLSVWVTAGLNALLPDLMASTGRRGTEFIAIALAPLFLAAASMGWRAWSAPVLRPTALIAGMLAASLAVGEHASDGAVKVFVTLSGLAWGALLLGDRENVRRVARWGAAACVTLGGLSLAGVRGVPQPSHLLALAVLYARLLLAEDDPRARARPLDVLTDVALLALIFLSTFRAATLAAVGALALAARAQATARWVLLAGALAAVPAFLAAPTPEPSYSAAVARDDWAARYGGMSEDRLSGRADIWTNVWNDLSDGPAWLLTGRGAGDVDLYVARVSPELPSRRVGDERALHTHNTFLELLIATGVLSLIPMAWLLAMAAARARWRGAQVGVTLGTLIVSASNVPLMDWTGGTLLMAVWLWSLARPEERAEGIDRGPSFAHRPAP